MSLCIQCGNPIPDGAKFCPVCGTPVPAVPVEEAPAPEVPVEEAPEADRLPRGMTEKEQPDENEPDEAAEQPEEKPAETEQPDENEPAAPDAEKE